MTYDEIKNDPELFGVIFKGKSFDGTRLIKKRAVREDDLEGFEFSGMFNGTDKIAIFERKD